MPNIRLPDGSVKSFPGSVTVVEVAQAIGPGLARAALAGRVNGRLVDTSHRLESDSELAIVTEIPGTTRDAVRQTIQIEGVPINIIDTAGLRDTDDEVFRLEDGAVAEVWEVLDTALAFDLLSPDRAPTDEDTT